MVCKTICVVMMLLLPMFSQQPRALSGIPSSASKTSAIKEDSFTISGIVVDMVTGEPLPKTSISIALTAGPGVFREGTSVQSGSDGRFSFSGVKRGKYMLSATRRGYSLQSFEAHDEFSTAIVTGPEFDTEHLLFRLRPDGSVHGQITDDQNDPVPNATVHLAVVDNRTGQRTMRLISSTQTDDRGDYTVAHLPPGNYYLAVVAKPWYAIAQRTVGLPDSEAERTASLDVAFPVTYYSDTTDPSAARPLKLQPGERVTADLILHAVPALRLQMPHEPETPAATTEQRIPQSGRRVFQPRSFEIRQQLFGAIEMPVPMSMDAQPDGSMEATGLPPGEYEVLSGSEGSPTVKRIDLRSTTSLDTEAEGARRTSVHGTIEYDLNVPKSRTTVALYSRTTGKLYFALADDKNNFRLNEPVESGTYEVVVNSSMNSYVREISAAGAKVSGRVITIGGTTEAQLKLVVASGTGEVNGVAILSEKPCAAAMIILVPENPKDNVALFRRDQSDSDGTFTLPNAVPGKYMVLALGGAWEMEWLNADVLQKYMKSGTAVTVEAGSRRSVTVQVQNVN